MWLVLLFFTSIFAQRTSLLGEYSQAIQNSVWSTDSRIWAEDELYYIHADDGYSGIEVYGYTRGRDFWESRTMYDLRIGRPIIIMQADGNLVMYALNYLKNVLWSSGYTGRAAPSVHLNADGNLIQSANGAVQWSSFGTTQVTVDSLTRSSTLDPKVKMSIFNFMEPSTITNGNYTLRISRDRLFITDDVINEVIWLQLFSRSSDTAIATIQPDGNFIVYHMDKSWESNTTNLPQQFNTLKFINNEGVFGIVSTNGTVMWRSDEYVRPIYTTATSTSATTSRPRYTSTSSYWYPPTPTWGYTWGSWGNSGRNSRSIEQYGDSKKLSIIVPVALFAVLGLILIISILLMRRRTLQ
eukprot:TRINITY_DN1171_c0_g1_i11.p1 TRINITY_DN1171_c0_g1~~TRINITY_DN1171_c0_g1_i11.p1  ORF type:complete len:354 (+),score=62.70 TRINITY_DN1171_c0_g1_i11:164-1225(+)